MDDFGKSDGLPDPPTCLITVFATPEPGTSSRSLAYSIPVKGVVSTVEKIVISRLLDPFTSPMPG